MMKACYLSFLCFPKLFSGLSMPTSVNLTVTLEFWQIIATLHCTSLQFSSDNDCKMFNNKIIWFQIAKNAALCRGCGQNCDTSDAICCLEHVLSELLCGKKWDKRGQCVSFIKICHKTSLLFVCCFFFLFFWKKGYFDITLLYLPVPTCDVKWHYQIKYFHHFSIFPLCN